MNPHLIERSPKGQRERRHHDNDDSRQETESTTSTLALQVLRTLSLMYVTRLIEAHRKFSADPPLVRQPPAWNTITHTYHTQGKGHLCS